MRKDLTLSVGMKAEELWNAREVLIELGWKPVNNSMAELASACIGTVARTRKNYEEMDTDEAIGRLNEVLSKSRGRNTIKTLDFHYRESLPKRESSVGKLGLGQTDVKEAVVEKVIEHTGTWFMENGIDNLTRTQNGLSASQINWLCQGFIAEANMYNKHITTIQLEEKVMEVVKKKLRMEPAEECTTPAEPT